MGRRLKSTDNRPIFPPESSDAPPRIVRNGQAKHPNRQIAKQLNGIKAELSAVVPQGGTKVETDKALEVILEKLAI